MIRLIASLALLLMFFVPFTPTTPPTLGNYLDTSVPLSGDTTVRSSAAPTNTTSINVSTSTNFKGKLEGDPNTGSVRVTGAHPAGTYAVTVTAFNGNNGPTTTKTFTLTVTTPPTCNPVSFAPAANIGVGTRPFQVVVGDFNGDGKQDLAVGEQDDVATLLGNGAGGFSAGSKLMPGGAPAVGDFNGDGKQDLAISRTSNGSSDISIYLGDGSGNFSEVSSVDIGCIFSFWPIAVGDFNGDNKQDLAAVCYASDSLSIVLGDGTGHFGAATSFGVGGGPQSVAVGDFNGDGKQDVAVANIGSGSVSVLLGDGAGGFGAATNFNAGPLVRDVVVGDFNGDGIQDLALPNVDAATVSVLLGDGTGAFGTLTSFPVRGNYSLIAVGDFNGDSKQDLAVPVFPDDIVSNGDVFILLGDGAGSFGLPISFGIGRGPFSGVVGDFNGDGMQDLAAANLDSNSVSILLRDCAPTEIQISNVIDSINNSALLPAGMKTSLNAKLQTALAALQSSDIATACSRLQDFLNELRAQRGKKVPEDLADELTNIVIDIRANLGCG